MQVHSVYLCFNGLTKKFLTVTLEVGQYNSMLINQSVNYLKTESYKSWNYPRSKQFCHNFIWVLGQPKQKIEYQLLSFLNIHQSLVQIYPTLQLKPTIKIREEDIRVRLQSREAWFCFGLEVTNFIHC